MNGNDKAREKRIRKLREAFAKHDEEEAQRIAAALPRAPDISEMKPGVVIAIHLTRHKSTLPSAHQ